MIIRMPSWMWGVYGLAVMRLTGLAAFDEITRPARERLISSFNPRLGAHRKLAYALGGAQDDGRGCPWCISVWVAAFVMPVAWWWGDHPAVAIPALALAASQVTGMLAGVNRG